MAMDNSRLAYIDCYEVMDRALNNGKGVRVRFNDFNECWSFRARLHYARRINRQDNAKIYDADHPLHGRSPYDRISCSLKQDKEGGWVYVKVSATENLIVEDLDGELNTYGRLDGEGEGNREESRGRSQGSQGKEKVGIRRI